MEKPDASSGKLIVINVIQDVAPTASQKQSIEGPIDDLLVITMPIDQCMVKRILVDTGSYAIFSSRMPFCIWIFHCLRQHHIQHIWWDSQDKKFNPKERFFLPVNVGDSTYMVEFLIIYAPSIFNCILGRLALNQLRAKIATCDVSMEVFYRSKVHVIYGDHKAAQECYSLQ